MKQRNIGYWVVTGLFSLAIGGSAFADFARPPEMVANFAAIGYPASVMLLLGIWKALGVVAILAPGFPRLKEWAYAGFVFELTGAAYAHLAAGQSFGQAMPGLVLASLALASWALRPASRRLGDIIPSSGSAPAGVPAAA